MDELSIWFAENRDERIEERVEAQVRGADLILRSKNGPVLILDTREVMRVILGDPD
jgi:hypothetical protein